MEQRHWRGVFPAITTPFDSDQSVDHGALAVHVEWMIESGCAGIVPLGSLGEAATLSLPEKIEILDTCARTAAGRVPIVAGVAGLATAECVLLAREAARVGCNGIMALPAYVYHSDWPEARAHYSAIIGATPLSCTPAQLSELAEVHDNLHAVKESSGDVRRVTEIREVLGDRLAIFAGLDDMILEAIPVGASGWIAGLVNALPAESVRLFELARAGEWEEAMSLYHWFLPLLRLDTVPKFVQLIKLVQSEVGRGSPVVRPPRLQLENSELDDALRLIRAQLARRPALPAAAFGRDNGARTTARSVSIV
jgi:1-pyrroline-4-hydroxy-2-carboxylate deaminase